MAAPHEKLYSPLGIQDTLQALKEFGGRHKIDPSRVYLVSECGGARNALNLAEGFPHLFAAVSLVNTAVDWTRETGYWIDANDPLLLAENLQGIPIQLIHGTLFPHSPIQQSYPFLARCKQLGFSPTLLTLPGDGRWADRDYFALSFEFFEGKRRVLDPPTVRFVTGQIKHDTGYWVRIKRFLEAPKLARVQASFVAPNQFRLTTENVAELELEPEFLRRRNLLGHRIEVTINGTKKGAVVSRTGSAVVLRPVKVDQISAHKTNELEGPISDVFAHPFLIVEGTQTGNAASSSVHSVSSRLANSWREWYGVPCRWKLDKDVTAADLSEYSLVLIGTSGTNTIFQKVAGQLPIRIAPESLDIGGRHFSGSSLTAAVIYPNPLNISRYVVVVTSNDLDHFSVPAPNLSVYGRFDAMVWQMADNHHSTLIGAGYWDNEWRQLSR